MASITITLTNVCSGGNHLTETVTGDKTGTVRTTLDDLQAPITADDVEHFARVVTRLAKIGRTVAQTRTLLQAGVTITI